MSKVDHRRDHG